MVSKDDAKKRGIEKKSKTCSDVSLKGKKLNSVSSSVKRYSSRVKSVLGDFSKKVKTKIASVSKSHREKSAKKSKYYDDYPKLNTSDKEEIEKHIKTISGYNDALKSEPFLKSSNNGKSYGFLKDLRNLDFLSYPFGIKLLVLFCLSNALLFFILALKFPYLMYFGFNLEGNSARYLLIFFSLVNILVSSGLFLRKKWSVFASMSWYGLGLISSFVSLFFIDKTIIGMLYDLIIFGLIIVTIMNLMIMWYIFHHRNFFYGKDKNIFSTEDKIFVFFTVFFIISVILLGIIISFNVLSKLSFEVSRQSSVLIEYVVVEDAIQYCFNSEEKDICLLTLSILSENNFPSQDIVRVCDSIISPVLKYTCYDGMDVR